MRLRMGSYALPSLRNSPGRGAVSARPGKDGVKRMDEHGGGAATEKFSQGTNGARRFLMGVSLIGVLVAIVPLSTKAVSVFGIGLSIGDDVLRGMLMFVLIYLTVAFAVRALTDLAASGPSRLEIALRERIDGQTADIRTRTMERLANLLPSGPGERFHSQSFESQLIDAMPKAPEYRARMIGNTLSDISRWLSREPWAADSEGAVSEDSVAHQFGSVLEELLASHEASCSRRRRLNAPWWAVQRGLIWLRFKFFDALAPASIGLLAIALLCGGIDSARLLELLSAAAR